MAGFLQEKAEDAADRSFIIHQQHSLSCGNYIIIRRAHKAKIGAQVRAARLQKNLEGICFNRH